jgi:SAM-dependent methyltransferase
MNTGTVMDLYTVKQKIRNLLPRWLTETLLLVKHSTKPKVPNLQLYSSYTRGKGGIEIGGPSLLFKTSLPIYDGIASLDGVNFNSTTVWEGNIKSGRTYNYHKLKTGTQFISDGTSLLEIPDESYDFVLSSNCLEHIANPIKALIEWKRILRTDGALILALPNKKSNFDHKRPNTPFKHLLWDFENKTGEDDMTHFEEIMELHDLSIDRRAGGIEAFRKRSLQNFANRTLHHHIFDLITMREMFNFLGMSVIEEVETDNDLLMLALKKPDSAQTLSAVVPDTSK